MVKTVYIYKTQKVPSSMTRSLSLSTSSVQPLQAEAAFRAASQLGYGGVELMIAPGKDIKDLDHIKNLIQKYQVPVTSVHAPTLLLCTFVWGMHPGQKLSRSVKFAEEVGATSVVVHPPFKRTSYSASFLEHVNKLNNDSVVDIAVENMFPWAVKNRSREMYGPSWEETCETVDNLTFDFSHASLSGMNVMEFFKKYHSKVRIIHLTDGKVRTNTQGDSIADEHLLPGQGDMPIREVYELLNEQNWKGETVLEINTRKQHGLEAKMPALQHSIDYFNHVANPALVALNTA
jgi:sugar phosphate isomerase/epimerase